MSMIRIDDFRQGTHVGTLSADYGGLASAPGVSSGTWTSPVFESQGPFTWAVASWNGVGDRIEVQVRAALPEGWSPWFSFGAWSLAGERRSIRDQKAAGIGRIETDTLRLERPARAWQLRVLLQDARLKRLWLATALPGKPAPDAAEPAAWGRSLPVPAFSQMVYPNGGNVWCSPTSLAMAMAFWGRKQSIPDQVAPGVYDADYDGHGNWPFNTAYAGAQGFVAYVDRFATYAELERWTRQGVPVICSVAYSREWLDNAPINQTNGHLLVVTGFTADGDVVVNDPAAAADAGVRLVYARDQFRRAWLDRGGVVYMVYPEKHESLT